nr:alpha/beta hydrolase fold domain-containing protein [Mesorhizobium sp.]
MTSQSVRDREDYGKLVAYLTGWLSANRQSIASLRDAMDSAEASMPLPNGMTASPWADGELSGQMVTGNGTRDGRVLLYLHGGGYHYGSSRSHRHLAAAIAAAARCDALVLDYRLAPEHPYPAAPDDAFAAYRHLLETREGGKIAVAGDSAGGGLAVATAAAARDHGLGTPCAIACLSPWLDLTCRDLTEAEVLRTEDPIVSMQEMRDFAASYLAGSTAKHPAVSPLHGDLKGLPPIYLQVGARELVARDSLALAVSAPSTVFLDLQAEAPHVWQWFWPRLPAARAAVERVGRFLGEQFG